MCSKVREYVGPAFQRCQKKNWTETHVDRNEDLILILFFKNMLKDSYHQIQIVESKFHVEKYGLKS